MPKKAIPFEKSFASHPRSSQWSSRNEGTPADFTISSDKKKWFNCKCGHTFDVTLNNISNGKWCPFCAKSGGKLCSDEECSHCYKKSFASHPRADKWSLKNGDENPRDFSISSRMKKWFDCKCGHTFDARLGNVTNGKWCPFCATNRGKLCSDEECSHCYESSFASCQMATSWSDRNSDKPRECAKSMNKKRWFNCMKCKHTFESALNNISSGNGCPYCRIGGILCTAIDCEMCHRKSFAYSKKAEFWSSKNEKSPRDFTISSAIKNLFDCDVCGNIFSAQLCHISNGSWCPHCKNKTEAILFEFLKSIHTNTIHQFNVNWCRSQSSNRYLPYDFCIPELKIIIELDGRQHFSQVSNWGSPEETQERDKYKEQRAIENQYHVIRLLQEDIWFDRTDWKTLLQQTIDRLKIKPEIIRLCQNAEYSEYTTTTPQIANNLPTT